jgi:hypothetical protein
MNSIFEDISFRDSINYVIENYIQFLMLLSVFVIIYVIDHISNINSMIFSMPSPIPTFQPQKKIKK